MNTNNLSSSRVERFYGQEDFRLSMKSDKELILRLGFSPRRADSQRAESDYLGCFNFYLNEEIERCKKNNENHLLSLLKKALRVVEYIFFNKGLFKVVQFSYKQSLEIAKLKQAVRLIILQYVEVKLFGKSNFAMATA